MQTKECKNANRVVIKEGYSFKGIDRKRSHDMNVDLEENILVTRYNKLKCV
jgi:hypothetical protein